MKVIGQVVDSEIEKSSNKNGVGFVGEDLGDSQVVDTTILDDDSALLF